MRRSRPMLFLASQAITLFGSSIVQFSIIWHVTRTTSSGLWVGLLSASAYLPQFLVSLFAGAWADRHSKKALIIISDASIAIATMALYFLLPHLQDKNYMIALIIASALRSIGSGIQAPAVNASLPLLAPEDDLMKLNGVNSTIQSLVQFASPAAAGAIMSLGSLSQALLVDIATAALGISLLGLVAIPYQRKESQSLAAEIKEGLSYSHKNQHIGLVLIIYGLFVFLCVPAGFLATLFVTRTYGDTYWYMTLVEVIGFIGMTLGGILIGVWGGFPSRVKTLWTGLLAFGLLGIGMGLVHSFTVYLVLMAIYGIALTMVQTACTTMLQESTAEEYRGRVFGLFSAMYSGFLPLGMLVFGPLADTMPMRALMVGSGLLLAIMGLAITADRRLGKR
jgi:DHA3 family macrolide efflux protein-like MFS transporter